MMFKDRKEALKFVVGHFVRVQMSTFATYMKTNFQFGLHCAHAVMAVGYRDAKDDFDADYTDITHIYDGYVDQQLFNHLAIDKKTVAVGLKEVIKEMIFVNDEAFQILTDIHSSLKEADKQAQELLDKMNFRKEPGMGYITIDSCPPELYQEKIERPRKYQNSGVSGAFISDHHVGLYGQARDHRPFSNPRFSISIRDLDFLSSVPRLYGEPESKNKHDSDFKQYNNQNNKRDVKLSPLLKSIVARTKNN